MNAIPDDCPWVSERLKCSPEATFADLVEGIKSDVDTFIDLHVAAFALEVHRHSDTKFVVTRTDRSNSMAPVQTVIFNLDPVDRSISAIPKQMDSRVDAIKGRPILDLDGRRRLAVQGKGHLELWQFRFLALEPLFFD